MKSKLLDRIGEFVDVSTAGSKVRAYVPPAVPPDPPIELNGLNRLLERANQQLGRVSGIVSAIPDATLINLAFMSKEAVLSSQIEGTQASFYDLVHFDSPGLFPLPRTGVEETRKCLDALNYGVERLKDGMPISVRLIKGLHRKLLGSDGSFRKSQNWIGGTTAEDATYVPPPHLDVGKLLSDLEKFYDSDSTDIPSLVKIAMIHAQFEMIHPFLDGNGRVGRILLMLMLATDTVLEHHVLFLSLYFKTHRQIYYEHLQNVSERGEWEKWVEFFLEGIIYISEQVIATVGDIRRLFREDQELVAREKVPASTNDVYRLLQKNIVLTTQQAQIKLDELGTKRSVPTIRDALKRLERLGIAERFAHSKRPVVYWYRKYMNILDEGTEPL